MAAETAVGRGPGRHGRAPAVGERQRQHDAWDLALSRLRTVREALDRLERPGPAIVMARDDLDDCLLAAELIQAADAVCSKAAAAVLARVVECTTAGRRVAGPGVERPRVAQASDGVRHRVIVVG